MRRVGGWIWDSLTLSQRVSLLHLPIEMRCLKRLANRVGRQSRTPPHEPITLLKSVSRTQESLAREKKEGEDVSCLDLLPYLKRSFLRVPPKTLLTRLAHSVACPWPFQVAWSWVVAYLTLDRFYQLFCFPRVWVHCLRFSLFPARPPACALPLLLWFFSIGASGSEEKPENHISSAGKQETEKAKNYPLPSMRFVRRAPIYHLQGSTD